MSLYVFGSNSLNQLGLPEDIFGTNKPIKLDFFEDKEIKKIFVSKLHTMILCSNNILYTWGLNDDRSLGRDGPEGIPIAVDFPYEIIDICGGASYSAILTESGHVYGCGTFKSSSGIFGFSMNVEFQTKFTKLEGVKKIKKIFPGHNHIIMIDDKNNIWTVGANESGQLGRPHRIRTIKRCLEAFQVTTKSKRSINSNFIKAAGGGFHSIAINELNQCFGWGGNFNGQLGIGSTEPTVTRLPIPLEKVVEVQCGYTHTIFHLNDRRIFGCGDNTMFQLGITGDKFYTTPTFILENVDKVRVGADCCIAQIGNQLLSWGSNINGELGHDELKMQMVTQPTLIDFDFGKIVDFGCGSDFTVVWTEN